MTSPFLARSLFLALGHLAIAGCSSSDSDPPGPSKDPWAAVALPHVDDENPDPHVVEISLHAEVATKQYPGAEPSEVWTYDGTVPGPLIEATVGDELVVHFQNDLPEPTTIHWHGVRVPASMDGSLAMQAPIQPGATFEYSFTLKDAGLFWFHPHIRSDVQIEKGLYGTILVHGPDEPTVDHEQVLVLDDVDVKPDGTFPQFLDDESKMMGREGNVLMINGVTSPEITLQPGSLQRLRIVNVANGRFFNLRLEGHGFRVIGTDGGLVPHPFDAQNLLVSPGERYDVLVIPTGEPGTVFTLWNDPYARGHDSGDAPPTPLATIRASSEPPLTGRSLPDAFPDIERLPATETNFPIVLAETFDSSGELVFTINGATFPDVPPFVAANGSLRVLRVQNDSDMDHPFHLHGFFFQTLSVDGQATPLDELRNKDTSIARAHSTMDLIARFDEKGMWMYHCHILEHAEGGMMGEIVVE